MKRLLMAATLCMGVSMATGAWAAKPVLMIADEIPQMKVLSLQLQKRAGVSPEIVTQDEMPAPLSKYRSVLVYIHKDIHDSTEKALIDYATGGGKLILLHHSISSGKRRNHDWLPFLGVSLPLGGAARGGYYYVDPAEWDVVNLAPEDPISTRGVRYPLTVPYATPGVPDHERPAFLLQHTEVYLNHILEGPRTLLLGVRYKDPTTGVVIMQDTAGWYRRAGKGWVVYFMPGHASSDFENDAYAQIITNAVVMTPGIR